MCVLLRKLLSLVICFLFIISAFNVTATAGNQNGNSMRKFTDSLGRTVELPENIMRIALSGPLTQIYVFPLCPELLVGFSTSFSSDAEKYIPDEFLSLPELGQLHGGKGTMNLESLMYSSPDLVIDVGEAKKTLSDELDQLTDQTGIPAVHIDATVEGAPEAYRTMGSLLGCSEKAEELASWCEETLRHINSIMEKVDADSARKSVVYCLGPKGLNVLANGSFHAEILKTVANNAALLENPVSNGDGNEIDMEQLMLWDPDVVLFQHNSIYDEVAGNELWSQLSAVKTGDYYEIPCGPYGWISSPPAVQCYLGMLWLADTLYPEYVDFDLQEEITAYYHLFYNYDLSDSDFAELTHR